MENILHFEILSLTLTVKMLIITLNNLINMKKLCKLIKKTKSKFRSARFKANIVKK